MVPREKLKGIILVSIIITGIIIYIIVIRSRIYYTVTYNVNLSNREEIIQKAENLDYSVYLHDFHHDYDHTGISSYVDRDLLNLLRNRIKNDIRLTLWPFYKHYLRYSFLGENHSKLYLTYNNDTIFSIKDQNNQTLFSRVGPWDGFDWFLNFAEIPYAYGDRSTLVLNELIFIEIKLEYVWECGYICLHEHSFEQCLLLNEAFDVILICLNYDIFID